MSVECTPPTLLSTSSSRSPLSAKLCSTCVHRSVQDLKIYRIICRPVPISYTKGIIERAVACCLSYAHLQVWCLPALLHHLCLQTFVPCVCIDPLIKDLVIYRLISRPVPISYTRDRAVAGSPSNAHLQVWCQPARLHHLCLVTFVP